MPYDKIIRDGGDLCNCQISANRGFSCVCGPSRVFQTANDGQLYLGDVAYANYSINYPIANLVG